ncbi:hypothetical protein JOF48_003842 [Arthrobacter stackebrandtii]|uniref:Uncharacterized protein n=1 Tax=Arthrobacter stackebrandtii TaxID=272161 RepID=A0ABS4Z1W4_9MICC|nr:hypothetical protein [Arthrobacter stackebrandtii]
MCPAARAPALPLAGNGAYPQTMGGSSEAGAWLTVRSVKTR